MDDNFSAFMIVVRHLLKRVENKTTKELNIIQYNIYNEVNTAWDNIGSWRKWWQPKTSNTHIHRQQKLDRNFKKTYKSFQNKNIVNIENIIEYN